MAQRIDQAARKGRQSDREQITASENRYDHAMRELTKVAASAHSAADQRTLLKWAGGGGMLAGCLLWSIIPGHIARALPESWHMPEKIATRVLREPSIRSEEHTSELQSLMRISYAVFCLKKKKHNTTLAKTHSTI